MEKQKPALTEVIKEAEIKTRYAIFKYARALPPEQHDEILQEARMKIFEKYNEIEPEGWKSLLGIKCTGIVLDYIKQCKGHQDHSEFKRLEIYDKDDDVLDVETTLGAKGIFSKLNPDNIQINWDLVARLASEDQAIHAFAKQILGFPLRVIGPVLNVEIARADQLVKEFIDRFDDPEWANDSKKSFWLQQTAFAFGISELLGWPKEPVKYNDFFATEDGAVVGSKLNKVDLYNKDPHYNYKLRMAQTSFFDLLIEEPQQFSDSTEVKEWVDGI